MMLAIGLAVVVFQAFRRVVFQVLASFALILCRTP